MESIRISGARENNLKDISLEIPRGKFTVITGVSGSGKSSLAFDTIFAEGQRRYIESLSAYARQFVEKIEKPDIDSIEGLSPSISVDQKTFQRNPRSTVGTITELYDFLRLLFARVATPFCPSCGTEIAPQSMASIVERIAGMGDGTRVSIFSPIVKGRKGIYTRELDELREQGFLRVKVDGELRDLDDEIKLARHGKHTIELLVDVVALKGPGSLPRLRESVELALRRSGGVVRVEDDGGADITFSERFSCPDCGTSYPEISPRLFSFNSPYGACPVCEGLGTTSFFDPELMVESWGKSIDEGAIIPIRSSAYYKRIIEGVARHFKFSTATPLGKLPKKMRKVLFEGAGRELIKFPGGRSGRDEYTDTFPGIAGIISAWHESTDSQEVRSTLARYITTDLCPGCRGSRLRRESMSIKLAGRTIHDITMLDVDHCLELFEGLELEGSRKEIADRILGEIIPRLRFLRDVGLGYLTLARTAPTLSGGEAQRIRLATQVGSNLTGVTYVLDEPTIGLHPRDNQRLVETLHKLRDGGNTIIVVEHDELTMKHADHIVDMGPGAGEHGGWVVASGTLPAIACDPGSLTGGYLSGRLEIAVPAHRRTPTSFVTVKGAAQNNLKGIDAAFPLGVFTCVTGVSGSGKSTLVIDTLYAALSRGLYGSTKAPGKHTRITGMSGIDKVIDVDQSPIGRTPRSNPATYTGLFTHVRKLFSMLPESRVRGYTPARFSFNVGTGRCGACQGDGVMKIEMHFLPDVYVRCEVCGARRYNDETLEVHYRGKSIADVLEMTVSEALELFENVPQIRGKLAVLHEVGLGYVRLGQPATSLSGGEAQRIKLARELSKRSTGRSLYILDEPTIGLHFEDVKKLIGVITALVDLGNTVIVIEHNMDVVKSSDYIIDLGPDGGEGGGHIVARGTPEEVVRTKGSVTASFLREALGGKK